MIIRFWSKHPGKAAIAFGLAGAAVYFLMIGTTLAHISAVSGALPLDMRPFGYTPQDVTQLFNALEEDGRRYYLNRQLPLDTVYPALLALTLVAAIRWFDQRLSYTRISWLGIAASLGAAVFDYVENLGIAAMILRWPDLPASLVHATSTASILKSLLTTSAVSLLLLLSALGVFKRVAAVRDSRHCPILKQSVE